MQNFDVSVVVSVLLTCAVCIVLHKHYDWLHNAVNLTSLEFSVKLCMQVTCSDSCQKYVDFFGKMQSLYHSNRI